MEMLLSGGRGVRSLLARHPVLLATGVLAAGILLLLSASLVGGRVLSNGDAILFEAPFLPQKPPELTGPSNPLLADPVYEFHPEFQQAREDLRDWRLPLWSPDVGGGQPLLAKQQTAALYPLNLPAIVFPFWESLAWIMALKLLVAGLGAFLFCRRLALGTAPSLLAGVAFGLGSYVVVWAEHPHVNVYVLLPWLLLATEALCGRGDRRAAVGLAALVGLSCLGGHPPSVLVVMLGVLAYAAFRILALRHDRTLSGRELAARAAFGVGGCALGTALGGIVVIPFIEILGQSRDIARAGDQQPFSSLLGFVAPEYWGRDDKVSFGGPTNYAERTAYFGVLPPLLAVSGLAVRRERTQLFFAGLLVASVLISIDSPVGFVAEIVRDLPVLELVNLNRLLVLAAFCGAVLSAYGLRALLSGTPAERERMLVVCAVAAAVPLGLVVTAPEGITADALAELPAQSDNLGSAEFVRFAAIVRWGLVAAAALGIFVALLRRPHWAGGLAALAIALTVLDLVTLSHGVHTETELERVAPDAPRSIRFLRRHQGDGRIVGAGAAISPNLAPVYGLRDLRKDGPPELERYERLVLALRGSFFHSSSRYGQDIRPDPRLADLFAVRYVMARRQYAKVPVPATDVVVEAPDHRIVVNRDALPRAWVAYGWRDASGFDQALDLVLDSSREELMRSPVIEGAGPRTKSGGGLSAPTRGQIQSDEDTHVVVEVAGRRPGYLVLSDIYYPGWEAEVDGRPADVLPANGAFRAVPIPAGADTVSFNYRPASIRAGVATSLIAALVTIGALLVLSLRRHPVARGPTKR